MEIDPAATSRYGVITPGADDGRLVAVEGLVEKPSPEEAPSSLAIAAATSRCRRSWASSTPPAGGGREIQLTDAMARLVGDDPFHGLRFEGTRFHSGAKIGFLEAIVALALSRSDLEDDPRTRLGEVLRPVLIGAPRPEGGGKLAKVAAPPE